MAWTGLITSKARNNSPSNSLMMGIQLPSHATTGTKTR